VDEEAAVLTSYFRERQRSGAEFTGRALMDLYGRAPVAASVLLRAIPPAEDPPVAAVAIDARPRIDAVLDEAARLTRPGLITLERARLLSGEIEPLWLGESAVEATRLTIYCGHADRVYQVPAFEAACELLYRRGIAGATVLAGSDGGAGGRRHRAQFLGHGGDAPLMVVAVGSGKQIGMLLPELGGLFRHPLMTLAVVRLCRRDGQLIGRPAAPRGADGAAGPAGMESRVKLTAYTSEAARHDGQPVHRAIVRRLRSAGVGGAITLRGIWGFHGDHAPHGDHAAHFPRHGHHVPVVTTVVDTPERVAVAFDVVESLTDGRALVTAETVLTPRPAGVPADQVP